MIYKTRVRLPGSGALTPLLRCDRGQANLSDSPLRLPGFQLRVTQLGLTTWAPKRNCFSARRLLLLLRCLSSSFASSLRPGQLVRFTVPPSRLPASNCSTGTTTWAPKRSCFSVYQLLSPRCLTSRGLTARPPCDFSDSLTSRDGLCYIDLSST